MSSESINRKTKNFALKLKRQRIFPAVVVGAEKSKTKSVAKSGLLESNKMVKKLMLRLKSLGDLYTEQGGNIIGCCAEVNAGNDILLKKPYLNLNEISFGTPLRPRTMQSIRICNNCNQTFI